MKRIYIHDGLLRLYQPLADIEGIQVSYASVYSSMAPYCNEIKKYSTNFEDTTFIFQGEACSETPINLDTEIIEKFRHTQLKVEHYLQRTNDDHFYTEYIYYDALSFLYPKFKNNEIDCVITFSVIHGMPFEIVALDLALHFGIPAYTFDLCAGNPDKHLLYSIWAHGKACYLNLSELNFERPDVNDYINYTSPKKSTWAKAIAVELPQNERKGIVNVLKEKIFYKSDNLYYLLLLFRSERRKKLRAIKSVREYYNKISNNELPNNKFVYYSLHQDPEASTMVREVISNQLLIIRMISESLPEGWTLCVKEHPAQFTLIRKRNVKIFSGFLNTQKKYRNENFYDIINTLPNVSLLSLSIDARQIVPKASAIATINGTVAYEANAIGVPVLLFGEKTPVKMLNGVFAVNSAGDCKRCLERIARKDYGEIQKNDILNNYFIEAYVDRTLNDFNNTNSNAYSAFCQFVTEFIVK